MSKPTTYDIHKESMTVEYGTAPEKQRNVAQLKALIAEKERELAMLKVRLQQIEVSN
jgi:hypothetical protein